MTFAPVVLFAYNRAEHARLTLEALRRNRGADETDLHVYSDGPKTSEQMAPVQHVRSCLRAIDGFKSVTIVERPGNMGLAASVIAGVTELLSRHPAVIVVEDDLVTAPGFLSFMNAALAAYAEQHHIFSVTGYNYPLPIPADYPEEVYLSYRSSSWGWGTWADRWRRVDWQVSDFAEFLLDPQELERFARGGDDLLPMLQKQLAGELDSWSIRFDYAHYKHDALCLHPVRSKLRNIGFDGSGIHCGVSDAFDSALDERAGGFRLPATPRPDPVILRILDARFRPASVPPRGPSRLKRALARIGSLIGAA
jgi:hypothetical protein